MNLVKETSQVGRRVSSGTGGYLPTPNEEELQGGSSSGSYGSERSSTASLWLSGLSLVIALVALALSLRPTPSTSASPGAYTTLQNFISSHLFSSANSTSLPRPPSGRTIVSPRQFTHLYKGCTSSQLLSAIQKVRVNQGGMAKTVPTNRSFALENFEYSFDWPVECPRPHVFTSAEACDLVGAFGGLSLNGDSLTRHVTNALFVILRNDPGGAVWEMGDVCQGDRLFDDGKECRHKIIDSSHHAKIPEPVCGGNIRVLGTDTGCPFDPTSYITHYLQWRSGAPRLKNILSTLVINSYGLHCSLSPSVSLYGAVMPLLAFAQTAYPRPLSLWMTLHAPGGNKPEQWLPSQGSGKVKGYNTQMETAIKALRPGETMIEGAVGYLDWYGLTDGASSFDGTHYMWQINMEKAMLVLNLMDALWTEAVEDGGLWDVES